MRLLALPPLPDALEAALRTLAESGHEVVALDLVPGEGGAVALDPGALSIEGDLLIAERRRLAEGALAALRRAGEGAALPVALVAPREEAREALLEGADLVLDAGEDAGLLAARIGALARRARLGGSPRLDALTGFIGATRFRELLAREFDRAARYRRALALIVIEARPADPEATRVRAQALLAGIRDVDIVGRLSDEHFAVLLPETEGPGGRAAGERLVGLVEGAASDERNRRREAQREIRLAAGVAAFPARGIDDPRALLGRALESLSQAGRSGGRRVVAYGESDIIWSRDAPDPDGLLASGPRG